MGPYKRHIRIYRISTFIHRWQLALVIVFYGSMQVAKAMTDSSLKSDNQTEQPGGIDMCTWERSTEETFIMNEDSTFLWRLKEIRPLPRFGADTRGQGTYSIMGDTIILNSDIKSALKIIYRK